MFGEIPDRHVGRVATLFLLAAVTKRFNAP